MPNEKRARHKAARQARVAELRRAQQRRRNLRRGGVVGIAVVIALVLALISGGVFSGGHKKKKTVVATAPTTTTTTTIPSAFITRTPPARATTCDNPSTAPSSAATTTTVPAKAPAVATIAAPKDVGFPTLDGTAPHYTKFSSAPPFCINVKDVYTATMKTTAGTIVIRLLPQYAPLTVNNFVFLAGYHFFDGIVFHRVIPGFVDQGGDPTGTGEGGPGYEFDDELPRTNAAYDAGALAMANSGANTNGSQFFLVIGSGGSGLKPAYSFFGQIVDGLAVADKINAGGTSGGTPKTLSTITSVSIQVSGPGAATSGTTTPVTTASGGGTSGTTTPGTTTPGTTTPGTTSPGTTSPVTTTPVTTASGATTTTGGG